VTRKILLPPKPVKQKPSVYGNSVVEDSAGELCVLLVAQGVAVEGKRVYSDVACNVCADFVVPPELLVKRVPSHVV
jgi:hypothetical protein